MKELYCFAVAATLIWSGAARAGGEQTGCVFGDHWETVDDFTGVATGRVPGQGAAALSAASSDCATFVGGERYASSNQTWLIRRTLDHGASWESVDDEFGSAVNGQVYGIAAESCNQIYAAGTSNTSWRVKESSDGGDTWTAVDIFKEDSTDILDRAQSVAVDGNGFIYVAGWNQPTSFPNGWIVRRSTDGGATWSGVDFVTDTVISYRAYAVVAASDGGVFVGGSSTDSLGRNTWIVRYSPDGTHWSNVDVFLPSGFLSTGTFGAAINPGGKVVFTGSALDSSGKTHMITRQSSASGPAMWTTIDDHVGPIGLAVGDAAALTPSGTAFVAGQQATTSGGSTWLTRIERVGDSSFSDSDAFPSVLSSANAATVDYSLDAFIAGQTFPPTHVSHWITRRLTCD